MHIFIYLLHFRGFYYLEVEHGFDGVGSTMEIGVELYSDEFTLFLNHGFDGYKHVFFCLLFFPPRADCSHTADRRMKGQ